MEYFPAKASDDPSDSCPSGIEGDVRQPGVNISSNCRTLFRLASACSNLEQPIQTTVGLLLQSKDQRDEP